jgi:hypothetical protein
LPAGRRLRAEELQAAVRDRLSVELVAGFSQLVEARGATRTSGDRPIASASHLIEAHTIHAQPSTALTWDSAVVPTDAGGRRVVLAFPMAMGNGSALPQPSGQFDLFVNGRYVLSFTNTKDNQRWTGEGCTLYFDVRDMRATAFGSALTLDEQIHDESSFVDGMGLLLLPPERVQPGKPVRLRVVPVQREASQRWFRLGKPLHPFLTDHLEPGLSMLLLPHEPARIGSHLALFGDLHAHSAEGDGRGEGGCGVGAREELFRFARDVANLDLFCLSEHDWQMTAGDWEELTALSDGMDQPGRFVSVPGYEWTSPSFGHRNVYLRDSGAPMFPSSPAGTPVNTILDDAPTPNDLWRHLSRLRMPAITIPHHMSVAMFPLSLDSFHNADYDRVAEIYSCWGDSLEHGQPVSQYAERIPELAFIKAIRKGYRVGFVASSDSHDGYPGAAQGKSSHTHLFHHLGSGRVVVLADTFDRHGIFDALQARRCYAVTGPRILIGMSVEGHAMGSEISGRHVPPNTELALEVASAAPLDRIEIYRNGLRADTIMCTGRRETLTWIDPVKREGDVSYFAKIRRTDHEAAWTSPIWVNAAQ